MRYCFLLLSLLLSCTLAAIEEAPWVGNTLELEFRAKGSSGWYSHIENAQDVVHFSSHDNLLDLSLLIPVMQWSAEVELLAAQTELKSLGFTAFRTTGKYQWMNDIIGDPVSVTTGLTMTFANSRARHDVSLGFHAPSEFEMHIALGKEIAQCDDWTMRGWGFAAFGLATRGCPWARADFALEHQWCKNHRTRLFINGQWGGGNQPFVLATFNGYGKIDYHSVDLGFRYAYLFCTGAQLFFEYMGRATALSCPTDLHRFSFGVYYPFSL